MLFFSGLDELPIDSGDTWRDPVLARVLGANLTGWPNYVTDEELKPYFTHRNELTADPECVLWGMHVIIPPSLKEPIIARVTRRASQYCCHEKYCPELPMVALFGCRD